MQKRIEEIDILKGIGMIAVVLIHITAIYTNHLSVGIINCLLQFAVPLYLSVSAILLMNKYKEELNYKLFYKRYLPRIIIPYAVWSIIYCIIYSFRGRKINNIIDTIFFGQANYHLYFMIIILQFYLLFPLIRKSIKNLKNFEIYTIALVILQIIFLQLNSIYVYPYFKYLAIPIYAYIMPIGLGLWLGKNYNKKIISKKTSIVLIILAIIGSYLFVAHSQPIPYSWEINTMINKIYYTTTLSVGTTVSIFRNTYIYGTILVLLILAKLIIKYTPTIKNILISIGKTSFGIYLVHPLFLEIADKYITILDWKLAILTKLIFVMGLSYIFTYIVSKIKGIRYLMLGNR